jgi:DNA-binding CsgD family transcriptional regulator
VAEDTSGSAVQTRIKNSELIATLACSLFWAFTFSMFHVLIPLEPDSFTLSDHAFLRFSHMLSATLAVLLFAFLLSISKGNLVAVGIRTAALFFAPALAVVCLPIFPDSPLPIAFRIFGGVVSGIGEAAILIQIGLFLLSVAEDRQLILLSSSVILGALLSIGISSLPLNVSLLVVAVLIPVAQLLVIRTPIPNIQTAKSAVVRVLTGNKKLFHLNQDVFLFALIFGFGSALGFFLDLDPGERYILPFVLVVPGSIFLFSRFAFKKTLRFDRLEGWLFSIAVIALLLTPFVSSDIRVICVLVILFAYNSFSLLAIGLLLKISGEVRPLSIIIFVSNRAAEWAGLTIGWLIGYFIMQTNSLNESLLLLAVIILLTVFIIARNLIQTSKTSAAERASSKDATPWKDRIAGFGDAYKLSPKEKEVVAYLARGRTSAYIGEQLFLSQNTIKSHTYRIYQKTGIHSQQELIEMIESWNR